MTQPPSSADLALPELHGAIRFVGADVDDADALAERLVTFALARNIRLVTAESCTAGLIAHTLSRPAGSASVLVGGFVTYTKDAKTRLLGVSPDLFGAAGAVDRDVARAMARGAAQIPTSPTRFGDEERGSDAKSRRPHLHAVILAGDDGSISSRVVVGPTLKPG